VAGASQQRSQVGRRPQPGACRAIWNAGSAGTRNAGFWLERWLEPKAADRRTAALLHAGALDWLPGPPRPPLGPAPHAQEMAAAKLLWGLVVVSSLTCPVAGWATSAAAYPPGAALLPGGHAPWDCEWAADRSASAAKGLGCAGSKPKTQTKQGPHASAEACEAW
jgi:hypothetical protein